jgi:hypothetical protein
MLGLSEAELAFWLSPWVLGLLGLCIGSFLNVVAYRLPQMMERQWLADCADHLSDPESVAKVSGADKPVAEKLAAAAKPITELLEKLPPLGIATPRSRCPHCGHQLRWHENLPLVGWLRLGGKCAACKAPISLRYPVVEAATGAAFAALAWQMGPQRDGCLAGGALATQAQPADKGQVLVPAQLVAAMRATRARRCNAQRGQLLKQFGDRLGCCGELFGHRLVGPGHLGHRFGVAEVVGAVGQPLPLHHLGQAVRHDVEEAADAQAEEAEHPGRQPKGQFGLAQAQHQTTWPSLKMGMYIETTMPPIKPPRITMMKGSMRLESALTASSTSSS